MRSDRHATAAACSRRPACSPSRPTRRAPRRCCAASGSSTTCSNAPPPDRRRTCPTSTRATIGDRGVAAPAAGGAPQESDLRVVPPPDGSARLRPRELRRRRRVARPGRQVPDRRLRRPARRPTSSRGRRSCAASWRSEHEAFARRLTSKLLTYALGRGLERYDRRTVQEIAGRLPASDYRFSASCWRSSTACRFRCGEEIASTTMIVTASAPAAPHVPQGHGRRHRAAVARRDDARLRARPRAGAAASAAPPGLHLRPERRDAWRTGRRAATGADFEFTRILKPLEPFRDDTLVLSRARAQERQRARRRAGRPRARRRLATSPACTRSKTAGADIQNGVSVDQIAAQHSAARRASPRSSSAATTRGPSATATPATPAPTPTASSWRGADDADAARDQPAPRLRAAVRRRRRRASIAGDARAAASAPPQHPRPRHARAPRS